MSDEQEWTSVGVKPATHERLRAEGQKEESFDDLLNRLLDELAGYRKRKTPQLRKRVDELEKRVAAAEKKLGGLAA